MSSKTYIKDFFLLVIFMFFFGFWSIHIGQDINWDLLNYHFYNPYAFLHNRLDYDFAPAMSQTYLNPFLDIFNFFLIVTQKPIVTSFILGSVSGITAFFLYKIALLCFEKWWFTLFSVFIGITGYASMAQLGSTTNETKIACLITMALYLILKHIRSPESSKKYISAAGLFIGLAVGFKLTGTPIALGILCGFVFTTYSTKSFIKPFLLLTAAMGIGFLISNGYWMYILYKHFQNPFFPFYNNLFHSPYAAIENFKDERFIPQNTWHFIFLPFYFLNKNQSLTTEAFMRDPRLATTFFLMILFLLKKMVNFFRKKETPPLPQEMQFLLATFLTGYFIWLIQFSIYRYTIMLEILSGILIVYFASGFFKKIPLQIIVLLLLCIGIRIGTYYDYWGRVEFGNIYFNSYPLPQIPEKSLVILLGDDSLAYMVPFIASNSVAVGVGNNFLAPHNEGKLQEEENQLILNYKGPLYSLSFSKEHEDDKR